METRTRNSLRVFGANTSRLSCGSRARLSGLLPAIGISAVYVGCSQGDSMKETYGFTEVFKRAGIRQRAPRGYPLSGPLKLIIAFVAVVLLVWATNWDRDDSLGVFLVLAALDLFGWFVWIFA